MITTQNHYLKNYTMLGYIAYHGKMTSMITLIFLYFIFLYSGETCEFNFNFN